MKNMVKRFIRKADKLLFNGWLIDQYQKIRNKNRMFFHKNKCVVINEPVADLVIMQYSQMENEFNEYQFYDLAVRYLAIGQYYGKNKEGYRLYKMMHSKGGNYGNRNESEDYYQKQRMRKRVPRYGVKVEEHSIEQYEALIKSYESEGYKEDSVLMADRNLLNMNGSHRIALSVYFEREFVNVEIHNLLSKRRYNKEFFWSNGFDFNEIALIENTQNLIFQKCRKAIGDFYCILFPPAVNYFDDIVKDMERMDPDNIRVSGWEDIHCSVYEFVGYIKMLYSFDSISQENFERKLQYILNASVIHNGQVTYRKVRLEIHNPKYRLKSDNGLPESVVTVRLKEAIRNRYKVKEERFNRRYAGDYDHDVIIHSTDNYLSNNAFRIIDGINRNISGIIDILNGYEYAILESSIDKIPLEFPLDFYLCDDIDILINEDDMEKLAEKLMEYCKRTFHVRWVRFEKTKSIFGMRVKVLIRDSLLLMFDLMKKIPNIKEECTSELLKRRRNINRYYGLSFNDELVVRLAKFMDDQQKLHHLRFIQDSKDDFIFEPELFIRPKEALSVYKEIILKENVPGGGIKDKKPFVFDNMDNLINSITLNRDLSGLFNELKSMEYAVIQTGCYKQCSEFPEFFYIGDDFDLFVSNKSIRAVENIILSYVQRQFSNGCFSIIVNKYSNGSSIILKFNELIMFSFDLITNMRSLNSKFVTNSISRSFVKNGVKYLSIQDEMTYRLAAFVNSQGNKFYHADFIRNHEFIFVFDDNAYTDPAKIHDYWNRYCTRYN